MIAIAEGTKEDRGLVAANPCEAGVWFDSPSNSLATWSEVPPGVGSEVLEVRKFRR